MLNDFQNPVHLLDDLERMKCLERFIYSGEEEYQELLENQEDQEILPSMKYIYMEFHIDHSEKEEIIRNFREFLTTLCPNLENPIQVNDDHRSKIIFESRLVMFSHKALNNFISCQTFYSFLGTCCLITP